MPKVLKTTESDESVRRRMGMRYPGQIRTWLTRSPALTGRTSDGV